MTTEIFKQNDNLLFVPAWMEQDQRLLVGFSTRLGGVSLNEYTSLNVGLHVNDVYQDVIQNRKVVANKLNFDLEDWVIGEQVHGSEIKEIDSTLKGSGTYSTDSAISGVDGLYTNEKGILLVSLYADCTPLYFYSKKDGYIGLAHAGWRGTVEEIGPKMIKCWLDKGITLENIRVMIGPSIGKAAYRVDTKVIDQVDQVIGVVDHKPYEEIEAGQFLLDLKQVNYILLKKAGLQDNQIEVSQYCTATSTDLFFSHRKEKGKTGRMMSFIGYQKD